MLSTKGKAEAFGRKAKLAQSYQELLDEFSNKDLKSVGNYTLGRLIGKGSFGKVYLATHKLTNGSKVVLKSANKDDSNLAREIHHHRQFVHPHIARLYEVIVTESLVWLVLEYCPGDELYNYLLKHGKLPVEKVQKTFTQLVGAVCYVHRQSCVHRDLKLENILLDKHENVKLCDFGFTREYEGKANYLQTFCGTICYSAPEMLKGEKYAGEKVDVWSLGVILYALLCGELPFDDDDDGVTRSKILSQEPNYPDHIPPDALSLLKSLLSKRPLLRPTLPDILAHPFLAEYAPQQQEILKVERPEPFSTALEQETLHRMRSAGVDVDSVVESVLAQRCDVLAGWWTLLIEKEERKHRRRERKRREREMENRTSRRFSQASSRLNALATVEESQFVRLSDPPTPRTRGRTERRSGYFPALAIPDMPDISDLAKVANGNLSPDSEVPPPPIDKDSIRSVSSSRNRKPLPPPKEGVLRSARSRGSTLHLVTTSDALDATTSHASDTKKVKKRPSHAIIATWKNWTHWLFENTRRHKGSNKRGSQSTPNLLAKPPSGKEAKSIENSPRPQTSKYPASTTVLAPQTASLPRGVVANGYATRGALSTTGGSSSSHPPISPGLTTPPIPGHGPRLHTSGSYKRHSLSPSPLTPRSTVRRSSGPAGLRGRKSTSSSVSSVRSLHHTHHHSHSKASSTSSNGSVSTSVSKTPMQATRSPHHSVKVLPATPTAGGFPGFPSNIRLVRDRTGPPLSVFNEGLPGGNQGNHAPGSPNPFMGGGPGGGNGGVSGGGGVMFAKRKRNLFKGPMLSLSGHHFGGQGAGRGLAPGACQAVGEVGGEGSTVGGGTRGGMEEEEEREAVFCRLEGIGYRVGQGLVER
ncbi:Serine/threonine-protein kinase ppk16 [Staphylotrichum tortipilum]|uniref:Serine/threonine-protein kinase ppk16 n=1 Tax=Staphylotrichum tortipilum TaxID=2831512 RepID=A0AAN6RMW0_9PEZI|nr:Serine/threonine-protein kinase ppk16 [Staphylotrichum longicolle]